MERDLGVVEGYDRLLNVGHAYRMKGWYTKAVVAYALAARKRQRDPQALYYLGLTYYSMNQYYRALAWYKRSLALDHKMPEARRGFDWLSAYVSGDAFGEKGGAKLKASESVVMSSGAPKAEKSNGGVVCKK